MENLFANFNSQNEQLSNEANEELMFKIEQCPDFIHDLFEFLGQILGSESNPTLIKSVCIVIHEMIKKNWKKSFPDSNLADFVFNNLLGFTFLVPLEDRVFLSKQLFIFFHLSAYSSTIVDECLKQLNTNSHVNISTSLYIISDLIEICINENRDQEVQQYYSMIIEIFLQLISQYVEYFENTSPSQISEDKKEENNAIIFSTLSLIKFCMSIVVKPQILNEIDHEFYFFKIVEGIISLLPMDNIHPKMQTKISHFINSMIGNLFNRRIDSISNIQEFFKNSILQMTFESVLSCLSKHNVNPIACSYLIRIVRHMIYHKWFIKEIISEDFITKILIPACYIQADDLQNYEEIPENFIAFHYPFEDQNPDLISTRITVAELLKVIGKHFDQCINMILECCASNSLETSDEQLRYIDLESRLYIISCVLEFRPDETSIYEFLNKVISTDDQPLFLVSVAVFALQYMEINKEYLNALSSAIIAKKENKDVIITLFAVRLFNQTFNPQNQTFEVPISSLLSSLVELSSCVTSEEPAKMLKKLIFQFPDLIEENADDLITTLLNVWQKLNDEPPEKNCQRYLNLVIEILQKMDQNSQLYSNKSTEICEFFVYAINSFPDSENINDHIELLNTLLVKTNQPEPVLYEMIHFICTFIQDNLQSREIWMKFVVQLFINFIKKPNFFEFQEGSYSNTLMSFCEMMLDNAHFTSTISSIFILYSVAIQVNHEKNIEFVDKAIDFFSQESIQRELYTSSLVILSSALYVDCSNIYPKINEKVLLNISNNISILKSTTDNYASVCLIGLCILSMNNEKSYLDAISVLNIFIERRMSETNDDEIGDDTFESDSFQNSSSDLFKDSTYSYNMPFDSINPFSFFLETSNQTNLYKSLLSEEDWKYTFENASLLSSEF